MAKDAQANEPSDQAVHDAWETIRACLDKLEAQRIENMNVCREIRGEIKTALDEAKEAGVNKKALKAKIKQYEHLLKADACRADLESDEQSDFDLISQKLGDLAALPLGIAALAKLSESRPN